VGFVDQEQLKHYLQNARAFVFCRRRFWYCSVESGCGTPVIAFGRGVLETVVWSKRVCFQERQRNPYMLRLTYLNKKFDAKTKHAEKFSKNVLKWR
jgi:hypothetical protein